MSNLEQLNNSQRLGVVLIADQGNKQIIKTGHDDKVDKIRKELYSRINNWENVFTNIVCEFIINYDLFRGTGGISTSLNTKNAMFNPVVKQPVEEIVSYLKTNPRSITVNIKGQKEIQDIVNEIIGKLMNDNHLYNKMLKSFVDYLIYGISLVKLESDSDKIINIKNVDMKTCMWDLNCEYDDFKPSFFISEYIDNNFSTSNKYGHDVTRRRSDKTILERLNVSRDSILEQVRSLQNDSKTVSVYYGDDVFNEAKKKLSKVKVNDGLSQILDYYVLENIYSEEEDKVIKYYKKYTFVNDIFAEETTIPYESFPYIAMAKYVEGSDRVCDMFDSKIKEMKSEIIQINIIENSIADSIACNANGALLIKKSAMLNKNATASELKSGIILIDEAGDGKLSDVMVNLPPLNISPVMIEHLNNLKTSIKSKFGLINFDPNMIQAKSGYHEAMRLDRESQSISSMVSVIDNSLLHLGEKMIYFIKEYSKKSLTVLSSMSDHDDAKDILSDFSNMIDIKTSINVSESRESPNQNMRKLNQLQSIIDTSGQDVKVSMDMIADATNAGDDVKQIINSMNVSGVDPMREAEIKEKNASAMSKEADAAKKIAEAQDISRS